MSTPKQSSLCKLPLNFKNSLAEPAHGRGRNSQFSTTVKGSIDYSFNQGNCFGLLGNVKIFVKISDENPHPDPESIASKTFITTQARSLQLVHPNILPAIGCYPGGGNRMHTLYHAFSHSFVIYIIGNRLKNPLVAEYIIPDPEHPNESIKYKYLTNKYRTFFRGIIRAIIYLHKHDLCLSTLNIENFVIHQDVLKLCGLDTIANASIEEQKNDFKLLADILKTDVFVGPGWTVPIEVQHLIDCMLAYKASRNDDILLENHLAVLETTERIGLIKRFKECKPFADQSKYCESVENKTKENWILDFEDMRNYVTHSPDYMKMYKNNFSYEDSELPIMAKLGKHLLEFQKQAHHNKVLKALLQ